MSTLGPGRTNLGFVAWSLTRFPGHLSRGDDERRSATSSNGADSPPATTTSRSSTAPPPSSTQSSPALDDCETRPRPSGQSLIGKAVHSERRLGAVRRAGRRLGAFTSRRNRIRPAASYVCVGSALTMMAGCCACGVSINASRTDLGSCFSGPRLALAWCWDEPVVRGAASSPAISGVTSSINSSRRRTRSTRRAQYRPRPFAGSRYAATKTATRRRPNSSREPASIRSELARFAPAPRLLIAGGQCSPQPNLAGLGCGW